MDKPVCQYCGEVISWATPFHIKTGRGRFCSKECADRAALKIPESEWPELVRLYRDEGLTSNEIGARYNCTGTVVLKVLRRYPGVLRYDKSGKANSMYGRTHTPEARAKIRAANQRQFASEEARQRHAELTAKQIQEGRTGKAYNKVERAFASLLDEIGVSYQWQAKLGRFVFDFLLTDFGIMVEVHGTFWHADPRFFDHSNLKPAQAHNVANDARKHRAAIDAGYGFAQFWEHDIHNDPLTVRAKVLAVLAAHSEGKTTPLHV